MRNNDKVLVAYVPVLHRGYLELLKRHEPGKIGIIGLDLLQEIGYREKEIRALDPAVAALMVKQFDPLAVVEVLDRASIHDLRDHSIVAAGDEVTRALAERYWQGCGILWDTAFLRWDAHRVFSQQPATYDRVSFAPGDVSFMKEAVVASRLTSDWWRQVGAVLVRDGRVWLRKYNRHLPSEHSPYAVGDPRDFVQAGTQSELASAAHAEQQIIGTAAGEGVSLRGTSLYVTVFPCPMCAKLIAYARIKTCYFASGHASLDGVNDLKQAGAELVWVPL